MSQVKWSDEKKSFTRRLRYKDEEIQRLNELVQRLENERSNYRDHAAKRMKWWIELHGKGSSPNVAWLIEQDAKFLSTVSSFIW